MGTQCCLTVVWSQSTCLNMCEEWSSTYQMLLSSSPEGLRGHTLPRDHSRLLALTHAWQHPPLAVIPGVGTEPWKGALCQLEEDAKGSRWGTAGHLQRLSSQSVRSCLRGTLTLLTEDVVASPQWWELKWVKSTLCPSKRKSRQTCKEHDTVSETVYILLWDPRSLIKAPTGLGISLSFPDFIPWLDTRKGLQGWDV